MTAPATATSRLLWAALALVPALLLGCGSGEEQGPEPGPPAAQVEGKPNVIVVMTDDQTLAEIAQMPQTRRLIGGQGVSFENYYVSFPLCCPSRATYLTGRYAHNSGVLSNRPETGGGYPSLQNRHTLAVWMDEAGYTTASVGRYLNFYGVEVPDQIPPGWDEWYTPPGPSTYVMYDYELNQNGELVSYGSDPDDYQTDVYADLAVDFVERQADEQRPFFLSVTPLAPHDENDEKVPSRFDGPRPAPRHADELNDLQLPRDPSRGERDVSDKPAVVRGEEEFGAADRRIDLGSYRRRGRSLLAVDEMVQRLVTTLTDTGQLERTWIMFTSDNGYLLGEHRLKGKITPYDEVVHLPLLIRGPGVKPGSSIEMEAANLDLAPTIADIGNAVPDRSIDGVSLLDVLRGGNQKRRDILLENLDSGRVPDRPLYTGVINRDYSYVEYKPRGTELYDLRTDPDQLENLAGDPSVAAEQKRLAKRVRQLRDCKAASCR